MDRKDQFSYEGLELIFDYIEEYEQETGEQIELDVIALCCEWSEDTPEDIAAAVVYLASNEAGWVTGQTLHVNGGMAMI
jgi:NAD(P)-dependent dehydrogenase (short-subunit alcohol dehydrogenase family)